MSLETLHALVVQVRNTSVAMEELRNLDKG